MGRKVLGFPYRDGMGCYPMFVCEDWSQLHADLEDLSRTDLVSLSLVADPFGEYDEAYLHRCFEDVVLPFKEHFIVDLHRSPSVFVNRSYQRRAKKTLKRICVERCENPALFIDEWIDLYSDLVKKYSLKGMRAFSRFAFARQLSIPGIVCFRAMDDDTTIAMHLWYLQGDVAYSHLSAQSSLGRELWASIALYWFAMGHFGACGLRWLELGGGRGTWDNADDGLAQFKKGWSTGTRTAYFCGRVLDPKTYWMIVKTKGIPATDYFPAYREGEFRRQQCAISLPSSKSKSS